MKVGDLIRFSESGYTGVILGFTKAGFVHMFINEDVNFNNPAWITLRALKRTGEVISSVERDTQG